MTRTSQNAASDLPVGQSTADTSKVDVFNSKAGQQYFRDQPLTGHIPDITKPTRPHLGHRGVCISLALTCVERSAAQDRVGALVTRWDHASAVVHVDGQAPELKHAQLY